MNNYDLNHGFDLSGYSRERIPRTQQDRENLGIIRNKQLRNIRCTSIVLLVTSIVSMVIGILAVIKSGPDYKFPYVIGGAAASGFLCSIMALVGFCMVAEGRKCPTGDRTTGCFKCLVACEGITGAFGIIALTMGLGFAVWGTAECATRDKNATGGLKINFCEGDSQINLILSICTVVACALMLIIATTCSCFYCCHSRAFGRKTKMERLYLRYLDMAQGYPSMNNTGRVPYRESDQGLPRDIPIRKDPETNTQAPYNNDAWRNTPAVDSDPPPSYKDAVSAI